MPRGQHHVLEEILRGADSESASGNTRSVRVEAARTLELFLNVSANTGDFDFNLQTSADDTNFVSTGTLTGVTGTGVQTIVINRADDAVGRFARFSWVRNSGSATFDARLLVFE